MSTQLLSSAAHGPKSDHTAIRVVSFQEAEEDDGNAFEGLSFSCTEHSFRELERDAQAFARAVAAEVPGGRDAVSGRVVVHIARKSYSYFAAFHGVQRLGGIAAPIDRLILPEKLVEHVVFLNAIAITVPEDMPAERRSHLRSLLAASKAPDCVVICPDEVLTSVRAGTSLKAMAEIDEEAPVNVASSATLALMMTSGTTGSPKFVQIPQYYMK